MSPFRRLVTIAVASWFSLLTADLPALHACAMHGGDAAHMAHAAPAAPVAPAAHHHDASHDASAGASVDAPTDAPEPTSCSCLGDCCAVVVTPLQSAPESLAVAAIAATHEPFTPPSHLAPRGAHLRLPYANGPPSQLTA